MGRKTQVKLRGAYGTPISKMAGQIVPLTLGQVHQVGKILVDSIKAEIRRDIALTSGVRGPNDPVPIPNSDRFLKSFTYRVKGTSTIEIISDWPTASAHTNKLKPGFVDNMRADRSAPIEMTWLAPPKVPYARLALQNGEVIVRTTPDPRKGQKSWVHPGFRKYTFLERGLRKGRVKAAEAILAEALGNLLKEGGVDLFR